MGSEPVVAPIRNPKSKRTNRLGETWDQTVARVHVQYPNTASLDWREALKDYDLMGRVMRDVLRVGNTPQRRGHRPLPDFDAGMALFRQLRGEDFTVLPFTEAFAALAATRSGRGLAHKTGITRTQVQRLLTGVRPSLVELELIAEAFGKTPFFFQEYRNAHICALLAAELDRSPETSIGIVRGLGLEASA